jgi:hypothetical protein
MERTQNPAVCIFLEADEDVFAVVDDGSFDPLTKGGQGVQCWLLVHALLRRSANFPYG